MATITGTNGNDSGAKTLNGTSLADQIFGLAGNDTLIGFNGDDVLEGGKGADEQFGSFGFDIASYRSSGSGVFIDLGQFRFGGGHADGDTLFDIEGVIGSAHDDELLGSDERNVLRGEGGTDFLFGSGGNDLIAGGGGSDGLIGGAGADELRGDGGTDFLFFELDQAVTIDLAAGKGFGGEAEGDRYFGIEGVGGTRLNDRISGNAAANQFAGDRGADVLAGGAGADRFFYLGPADSTVAAPDRILDFSRSESDKIVIGDTIIEGNTTDLVAGPEFKLVLDPLLNLQASDFIFADIDFGPPFVV